MVGFPSSTLSLTSYLVSFVKFCMLNRLSLRLDISTKKSSFHTVYWWGTHSAKRCCVEPLLPPSDHLKKSHDIYVETRETWHPTVTWTEVYTDVFQKSCDTSRGPHALWHITWHSCNTRFFCLRIRWKKSEWYAGLSLWRWCRWWVTWAFTGVIQRHVLNLESMGQATSTSTYQITTDTTVNSLCFRLSHSKWPQVSKK